MLRQRVALAGAPDGRLRYSFFWRLHGTVNLLPPATVASRAGGSLGGRRGEDVVMRAHAPPNTTACHCSSHATSAATSRAVFAGAHGGFLSVSENNHVLQRGIDILLCATGWMMCDSFLVQRRFAVRLVIAS